MNKKQTDLFLIEMGKIINGPPYHAVRDVFHRINSSRGTGKPPAITLQEWEQVQGTQLGVLQLGSWIRDKQLDPEKIATLVDEFRMEMMAKGKLYVDFKLTFQVYLTKGYLSRSLNFCRTAGKTVEGGTTIHTRGGAL